MTEVKPNLQAINGQTHKSKELQMEILMEKLRSKTTQYKNLQETSKAVRMTILDKRWAIDSADRAILQKCLDSLQHCIKVNSMQSLIERLNCLSRQLGLKFMMGTSGVEAFISSDMFYLEIQLETNGTVKDIKVHHEGKIEQQSCEELVSCIARGDFADFTAQLEGLIAIYQLNAEKKVKCKAFSALQSLETDLCTLGHLQSFIKDPWAQVHKSPIGFLQKRRGGHAMRLTYFVSPFEMLDKEKGLQPLTTELLMTGKLNNNTSANSMIGSQYTPIGYSATVLLEGSTSNKLQVSPIISVGTRPMGKSGPIYATLGLQNSSTLPACFTLKLSQPLILCTGLAKIMQSATEIEPGSQWNETQPLLSLVAQQAYGNICPSKQLDITKGLFVNLPDQSHCYWLCERSGLQGRPITSVPFTHPSHVAHLLAALRHQVLFNTLVSSVVRGSNKPNDLESVVMFELTALSWQHISISLEHPHEESMATLELDLTDTSAPRASVYTLNNTPREQVDEYISRVLQKSHSIPITLRALVKFWEREANMKMNGNFNGLDNGNFSSGLGSLDPGGDVKLEPGIGGGSGVSGARAQYPGNSSHNNQSNYMSDTQQNLSMMSQESVVEVKSEDKKLKKRKIDAGWTVTKKPKVEVESSSDSDDSEDSDEDSDISEGEVERTGTPTSQEFGSDLEMSGVEPDSNEQRMSDVENSGDGDNDELSRNFTKSNHKKSKPKKDLKSTSSLVLDLTETKSFMPSSVSITPIGTTANNSPSQNIGSMMNTERRAGIEIIPITTPPATLPSSITITPISSSKSDERLKSEKKSKSGEERNRDKKKKKRREDPMGPPDKLPPKQDPLTKPVSVSIKPAEGSPARSASPNTLIRKFSPSPTHGRSMSITKSPSPSGSMKSLGKTSGTSSHHSSPRHSPVQNSPKHLAGYSSPKNHSISSPKHSSSGSGKPSMSALKSAASGSPSSKSSSYEITKGSKISSSSKDGYSSSSSKEKEKKHSGLSFSSSGGSSPKTKSSSGKMKQLEITTLPIETVTAEPLVSPPNIEIAKTLTPSAVRNRKGSLSAIVDKLKSAQSGGGESEIIVPKSSSSSKDRQSTSTSAKISGDSKNSEYMVKPSSDGMKITINKTRTKDSSSKQTFPSSGSSTIKQSLSPQLSTSPSQGSPKTHTGLKPGVISGPASKKTQVMQSSKTSVTPASISPTTTILSKSSTNMSSSSSAQKISYNKSSSSSSTTMTGINLSKSKSTGSPKSSSSADSKSAREREREREKMRSGKAGSDKTFFSKSERHSSPSSRDEVDSDRKQTKEANFMDSLIKPLDTSKFQIPKLKNTSSDKSPGVMANDFSSRSLEHGKYPFPLLPTPPRSSLEISKSVTQPNKNDPPRPLLNQMHKPDGIADRIDLSIKDEIPQRLTTKNDQKIESVEGSMRPPNAPRCQDTGEQLLDFSASGTKSQMVPVRFPASPSVSLHIVHSPAPSPMSVSSPAITDDELMDEGLVGPGK